MYRGFLLSTYFNQIYDDIDLWSHGIGSHEKRTFLKFYVGIDIAKLNNVASAISSDGEVLIQSFKFTNDGDGFQLLTSKLESFEIDSIIIGLESTPTLAATSLNILLPITIRFVSLTHPRFSYPTKLLLLLACINLAISVQRRPGLTKCDSHALRFALTNAAHNVVKNNATFKAYYDAKMAENQTNYNTLVHCAGKLVRLIWKMLTDNVGFNID